MAIEVNVDIGGLKRKVKNLKAASKAGRLSGLHAVGKAVREAEIRAMPRQLDRPTPFTQRGVLYKVYPKGEAVRVFVMDNRAKYLKHNVNDVDDTKVKPAPVASSRNKYGNLPRKATIRKRSFTFRTKRGNVLFAQRVGRGRGSTIRVYAYLSEKREGTGRFRFEDNARREVAANGKKLMRAAMLRMLLKRSKAA